MVLERIKGRYAAMRSNREARDQIVELLSDPFGSYPLVPTNRKILSLLPVDALHRLVGKATTDAERSAIQWELTRRQGLGALKVAWLALFVSVVAAVISVFKD